jgi:hypothetical protein
MWKMHSMQVELNYIMKKSMKIQRIEATQYTNHQNHKKQPLSAATIQHSQANG